MNPNENNKTEDVTAEVIETKISTVKTPPSVKKSSASLIVLNKDSGKIDLSKYTPDELNKYRKMGNTLQSGDANSILAFGADIQNKLAGQSTAFLNTVRAFDAGEVGGSINDLLAEVNYIDIDPSQHSALKRFAMQIPGLKKLVMSTKKIFQKYDSVSNNINEIVKKLDQGRLSIIKDNNQLQILFNQNEQSIHELEELIIGGQLVYNDLVKEIEDMELHSDQYQDYEIADKKDFLNRLEKRLHDLLLTRVIKIQSLPQIRMVQSNNLTMVEKIQSSVTTTIPIWKDSLAIAVALQRQKNIADLNNKIYDTTNTILKKNAEMLKQNSTDIAKQNERGVVSIETLQKVNQDLLATLSEIKQIKEEGETARRTATKELEKLENELHKSVLNLGTGTGHTND